MSAGPFRGDEADSRSATVPAAESGEAATLPPLPPETVDLSRRTTSRIAAAGSLIGRTVGGYQLVGEIARGGMGVVYKARQLSLGRMVAVKLILSGQFADENDVRRFRSEAESAAKLRHPNIVAIHEVGEHDGLQYFSMELVEGRSLAAVVRDGPLSAIKAAAYIESVARAMHYAHQQGVLHRDLKPSNVLIDTDDRPRVTDFGLAKRLADLDVGLTGAGQPLGTPAYMPPEQAAGQSRVIGPPADVYALGATLYELLTGRPPFRGETAVDTLIQVLEREPLSPRLLNPAVPRDLETICLKSLEKTPARRYATANELADELGRFQRGEPIAARPIRRIERAWRWCRRKPLAAALATVSGLFLLSLAIGGPLAAYRESALRSRADRNYAHAKQAVDQYVAAVQADELLNEPRSQPLRIRLLASAAAYYRAFVEENRDDPAAQGDLADALFKVGSIGYATGSQEEARRALEQAIQLYERLIEGGPDADASRRGLVDACNTLASLQKDAGEYARADESFRKALDVQLDLVSRHPDGRDDLDALADTYTNLSIVQFARSDLDATAESLGQALRIRNELLAANPDDPAQQSDLAKCLTNLGAMYRDRGETARAVEHLELAIAASRRLTTEHPTVAEYKGDLARQYLNVCYIHVDLGDPRAGLEACRLGLEVSEPLAKANPNILDYQLLPAKLYHNLGILHDLTDDPAVLETNRTALAMAKKLAEENPTAVDLQSDLAICYSSLGIVQKDLGDPATALGNFAKALEIQIAIAEATPGIADLENQIAGTLVNAANAHRNLGQLDRAKAMLVRAEPYHKRALAANPRHPVHRGFYRNNRGTLALTLLAQGDAELLAATAVEFADAATQPGDYVQAAAWLGESLRVSDAAIPPQDRDGRIEQAIDILRRAVAAGYRDAEHLRTNPSLEPFRERSEFKEVVEQLDEPMAAPESPP